MEEENDGDNMTTSQRTLEQARSYLEQYQAAVRDLDAVRWRNITDEQPTGDGEYPVLVKLKHAVLPEVMYYVPESGCAAFWRREYHYVTDELVSTDSIWWRYVDKWLPLPKWED